MEELRSRTFIESQGSYTKDLFTSRAVILREMAMKSQTILSFHKNEQKIGEVTCEDLKVEGNAKFDFSWVAYPNGEVIVYFRFADKDKKKFNDMTERIAKEAAKKKEPVKIKTVVAV
jgi:hypothetical protein